MASGKSSLSSQGPRLDICSSDARKKLRDAALNTICLLTVLTLPVQNDTMQINVTNSSLMLAMLTVCYPQCLEKGKEDVTPITEAKYTQRLYV